MNPRHDCTAAAETDPRWAAVVARDAAADGNFVYSVKTTGVYCRPSCPSRQANRKNVRFHASAAEAEQAGFRPCARCRPDAPPLADRHAALVTQACRRIEAAESPPALAELAAAAGLSPYHFHRLFKSVVGLTPRAYGAEVRARRLRDGLATSPTVTSAIYDAGYGSAARVYEAAGSGLGMTPSAWRDQGAGEDVEVVLGRCSLGAVLVARTARGICAISLGDDPAMLRRDLAVRFSKARLRDGGADFAKLLARVIRAIEHPGTGPALPLDIRGTAFQRRVWQALSEIPAGKTLSYAELARGLGAPKAIRAVAAACAANTIAVAIPCHRAVRSDGGLAGYRWGVARKRALLNKESRKRALLDKQSRERKPAKR